MKVFSIIKKAVWWIVAVVVCLASVCFVFPRLPYGKIEKEKVAAQTIRIWNVDTFEGGKGSRTSFLDRVAGEFEKQNDGVLCMVSSKTIEGVQQSLKTGDLPDMISFGVGAGFVSQYCKGEALPWYRGVYAVYCLTDDFTSITSKNCVFSKGGENLPVVAAALGEMLGAFPVQDSTTAYVRFLNGDYKYLLGTQRDACRFASRGVAIYCQPIVAFSDLYGYIALTDTNNEKICKQYIDYLLSSKKQEELTRLGLMSPYQSIYDESETVLSRLEGAKIACTVHPFSSKKVIFEIEREAKEVLAGKSADALKNFMKFL